MTFRWLAAHRMDTTVCAFTIPVPFPLPFSNICVPQSCHNVEFRPFWRSQRRKTKPTHTDPHTDKHALESRFIDGPDVPWAPTCSHNCVTGKFQETMKKRSCSRYHMSRKLPGKLQKTSLSQPFFPAKKGRYAWKVRAQFPRGDSSYHTRPRPAYQELPRASARGNQ